MRNEAIIFEEDANVCHTLHGAFEYAGHTMSVLFIDGDALGAHELSYSILSTSARAIDGGIYPAHFAEIEAAELIGYELLKEARVSGLSENVKKMRLAILGAILNGGKFSKIAAIHEMPLHDYGIHPAVTIKSAFDYAGHTFDVQLFADDSGDVSYKLEIVYSGSFHGGVMPSAWALIDAGSFLNAAMRGNDAATLGDTVDALKIAIDELNARAIFGGAFN